MKTGPRHFLETVTVTLILLSSSLSQANQIFTADFDYESVDVEAFSAVKYLPMREPHPHPIFEFSKCSRRQLLDNLAGGSNQLILLNELDQIPIDLGSEAGSIVLAAKEFIAQAATLGRNPQWDYKKITDQMREAHTLLMKRIVEYLEAQKDGLSNPDLARDFSIVGSLPPHFLRIHHHIESWPWQSIDFSLQERWYELSTSRSAQPLKISSSRKEEIIERNLHGEIFLAFEFSAPPSEIHAIQAEVLQSQVVPGTSSSADGGIHENTAMKNEVLQMLKDKLLTNRSGMLFNYRMALYQVDSDQNRLAIIVSAPVYFAKSEMADQLSTDLRELEKEVVSLAISRGATIRLLYDEYQSGDSKRDAGWEMSAQRLLQSPKLGFAPFDEDF